MTETKNAAPVSPEIVDSAESLQLRIAEVKAAQKKFSTYTQEQVDKIFKAAAMAGNAKRIPLAQMAKAETKMGLVEDKVIKNHFATEYIYNAYKNCQTVGKFDEDTSFGFYRVYEPIGVIAAVVPTTNPTSTAMFKCLLALKTRNGIIVSPHPTAKNCTIEACKVILEAAVAAGAPEGIIAWVDVPSIQLSIEIMRDCDITLATGGPAMVKSAYSSGKPAVGVGNGNCAVLIHETADLKHAVNSVMQSKSFDNGTICASEQSVIIPESMYDAAKKEFALRGAYFLDAKETEAVRGVLLTPAGGINAKIVGRTPREIGELVGLDIDAKYKVMIGEVTDPDVTNEPFAHEKLSTALAMYKYKTWEEGMAIATQLIEDGGIGHTSVIYADEVKGKDVIDEFVETMKTCRILINMPSSQGAIGDLYNFKLIPSLTLGCGSWAGNAVSNNVGIYNLLNTKQVARRTENMLWLQLPEKVYFKRGCMPVALKELRDVYECKKVMIITDTFLYGNGYSKPIENLLDELGIGHTTFSQVTPDPTLTCAREGLKAINAYQPDCIIGFGGGSAMDAAKIMWIMYEHPECDFKDLALRFVDIRKRIYTFPKMGVKCKMVAIATSSGTGSEVTPFSIITDDEAHIKYSIADYAILPTMAIADADNMMDQPKGLTASSGIDVLTHALEAYVSTLATDFTRGWSLTACKLVFEYLPRAYEFGKDDKEAREAMAHASMIAGLAFANAFLGVNHSMAHKLGARCHVQHGIANSLVLRNVIRYNCNPAPTRMGTFPQYKWPQSIERYAEVADYCGIAGKTDIDKVENLLKAIEELQNKVNAPKSIKEHFETRPQGGPSEAEFLELVPLMAVEAFDDQCTGASPRYPTIPEIEALYKACYYGKDWVIGE